MDHNKAAARCAYICFQSAGSKLIFVMCLWAYSYGKAQYKSNTLLFFTDFHVMVKSKIQEEVLEFLLSKTCLDYILPSIQTRIVVLRSSEIPILCNGDSLRSLNNVIWSVRGLHVAGMKLACGQYVVGMWLVCGRHVVGVWSACGWCVVGMGNAVGKLT